MSAYVGWRDLEATAPELAATGQTLMERLGFVFLGTIRSDGTPRISAVEAHLAGGQLMVPWYLEGPRRVARSSCCPADANHQRL